MNKLVKDILEKLENKGYSAYIVGGYVRDFLLKKESNDYDICTSAPIKEVLKIVSGKVSLNSSLNVKMNDINIDITTYRIDIGYDNHKPRFVYTDNLESDLLRRDFTINTICMNKEGFIIDKLNGIDDLRKKIIRTVERPEKKLVEDPLRMLRAIRFATVLNFSLDQEIIEVIKSYGYLLKNLTSYRIKEELTALLISPNYQKGLDLIKDLGLEKYLGIDFGNVVYTKDLSGMWSQIKVDKDFPFTKSEKNNIVKINEIVKVGVINELTIYKYGLYITSVAADILGKNHNELMELYQNMAIYKQSDLAISFLEIKKLLNVEPFLVKKMENILIEKILSKDLKNDFEVLKEFILENKAMIDE